MSSIKKSFSVIVHMDISMHEGVMEDYDVSSDEELFDLLSGYLRVSPLLPMVGEGDVLIDYEIERND